MGNKHENELAGKTGDSQHSGISSGVNDNGRVFDDSHFQLKTADLVMPGLLMTAILAILAVLILLGIAGCATSPAFPPAGPQQKTAPIVANEKCIMFCSVQSSQATALEDIQNNTGPVTGGDQSQSNTQSNTQTGNPTISPTKTEDGVPKP
jgi:hypothetical protein